MYNHTAIPFAAEDFWVVNTDKLFATGEQRRAAHCSSEEMDCFLAELYSPAMNDPGYAPYLFARLDSLGGCKCYRYDRVTVVLCNYSVTPLSSRPYLDRHVSITRMMELTALLGGRPVPS